MAALETQTKHLCLSRSVSSTRPSARSPLAFLRLCMRRIVRASFYPFQFVLLNVWRCSQWGRRKFYPPFFSVHNWCNGSPLFRHEFLPYAMQKLKAAGYQMVTVAECLGEEPYQWTTTPGTKDVSLSFFYPLSVHCSTSKSSRSSRLGSADTFSRIFDMRPCYSLVIPSISTFVRETV